MHPRGRSSTTSPRSRFAPPSSSVPLGVRSARFAHRECVLIAPQYLRDEAGPPLGLTPVETAVRLDVSAATVRRWVSEGRLPATRVGGRYRIDPADLGAVVTRAAVEVEP